MRKTEGHTRSARPESTKREIAELEKPNVSASLRWKTP